MVRYDVLVRVLPMCANKWLHVTDRMMVSWHSGIYGFYSPRPDIEYVNGRRVHAFTCLGSKGKCKKRILRYLDTSDATSTSNMGRHAETCFGEDAVKQAKQLASPDDVRDIFVKKTNQDITVFLRRKKGSTVTYSHTQMTRNETR